MKDDTVDIAGAFNNSQDGIVVRGGDFSMSHCGARKLPESRGTCRELTLTTSPFMIVVTQSIRDMRMPQSATTPMQSTAKPASCMFMRSRITIRIPQATAKGYIECPLWGVFDWSYPESNLRRGRVQEGGQFLQH